MIRHRTSLSLIEHPSIRDRVYIQVLGTLQASRNRVPLPWRGHGTGRRQLQRMLGYTILRCGAQISRYDLMICAGGDWHARKRPRAVVGGFSAMLKQWGLGQALAEHEDTFGLMPHDSWRTDTDILQDLIDQAREAVDGGARLAAYQLLSQAEPLCMGRYLVNLDPDSDELFPIAADYWLTQQRAALHDLAQLCLDLGQPSYWHARQAVQRALTLGETAADHRLAAKVYEHLKSSPAAAYHRKRAEQLDDES